MTKPVPGAKRGRPPTGAAPWATFSVRLPRPTLEAFRALPEATQARIRAQVKALVEGAIG